MIKYLKKKKEKRKNEERILHIYCDVNCDVVVACIVVPAAILVGTMFIDLVGIGLQVFNVVDTLFGQRLVGLDKDSIA